MAILGTRPEAIKLVSVIRLLKKERGYFQLKVCVTAQHREMLDQVLGLFNIKPDYDLNIMKPKQNLYGITIEVLKRLRSLFQEDRPDLLLIQGDTTTTFAASLAAFYEKIKIGHIEAGLRTYDKYKPFPEEINRHLTSILTDYHFAPTEKARKNLLKEGILSDRIIVTGNTVVDALLFIKKILSQPQKKKEIEQSFWHKYGIQFNKDRLILVTAHRRESFGKPFEEICLSLKEIVEKNPDVRMIYPVHLNPHVQKPVRRIIGDCNRIHLIPPVSYEEFVFLMIHSYFILTDSGGIQEEAPTLGKPVLVMREVTERPEAIEAGVAKLVGSKKGDIVKGAQKLLDDPREYQNMAQRKNPFGDGRAAQRIVQYLKTMI
ncbi:MAG: non-hydrolyzing UDP-N-acetylglucosamine 2-epimerase [Thermodesulfobacteriota bacterium]